MSFLSSLFLGAEGNYNVLGVPVTFVDPQKDKISLNLSIYQKANEIISILSLGYAHVFFHEMGHALSANLFKNPSNVEIYKTENYLPEGVTKGRLRINKIFSSLIALAGPMAGMAFSGCRLFTACLLKNYLPKPMTFILKSGAEIWMISELVYAVHSSITGDGDFGDIAQNGRSHHLLSTMALVGNFAFWIFIAMKMNNRDVTIRTFTGKMFLNLFKV